MSTAVKVLCPLRSLWLNDCAMLTEHDIKAMCLAGESALLDYKSEQYKLDAEGNKSKFVKDILAFANTYRPNGESGYILIGIRETERHRGEVVGIDNILDGNIYQQLIDGKANKSIPLNVATVDVEGRRTMKNITDFTETEMPLNT